MALEMHLVCRCPFRILAVLISAMLCLISVALLPDQVEARARARGAALIFGPPLQEALTSQLLNS